MRFSGAKAVSENPLTKIFQLMHAGVLVCAAMLFFALGQMAGAAEYGPGVTDTAIKIGNTNPYSGPAAAYGTIGKSLAAFWDMVNAAGGVNGRQVLFTTVDDGYRPARTLEQTRRLVERDKVLFVFQGLGTPTNAAIHTYMNKQGVPQLFVASQAAKWADPFNYPWTMGFQPNYQAAGKIFGRYILENKPDGRIAILYQNDEFGKDYVTGLQQALGERFATMVVAEESYEATDQSVDYQIVNLKASGADIFYNVAIPHIAAQAIKKAAEIGWQPLQLLNDASSSVSATLQPAGLQAAKGILSLAYLKDPRDPEWQDDPELKIWRAFMNKHYPDGDKADINNVYAYTAAQLMHYVLAQAGDELTRENIMKQAASLSDLSISMLLPGIRINTAADDFSPIEQMQMQRFDGERWVRFGNILSAD